MPLTYCRMRVNVNEKYIIHTLQEWSHPGCLIFTWRGKGRQSTPPPFIISFIDFLFFVWGEGGKGGGHRCLQLHCAQNQIFCHLPNQVIYSPTWAPPHLLLLKMAESRHLCFLPKLFTTQHENYMQWCNMLICFSLSGSPVAGTSALLFLGSILKSFVKIQFIVVFT